MGVEPLTAACGREDIAGIHETGALIRPLVVGIAT